MPLSRRNLLASLALALPAIAVAAEADAATRKKPMVKHSTHVVHKAKKPVHHVVHHPVHHTVKKKMAPRG